MPVPFRQESRATIRRRIGYLLFGRNKFIYGTVSSSPAASSFVLPQVSRYPDSTFIGRSVYVVSGTGAGQYRGVTSNTGSTGVVTVGVAFSPVLDNTSVVELWPELLTPDDINEAIDRAILRVSDICNIFQDLAPASFVLKASSASILGLTVPTSFVRIATIRYIDIGNLWHELFPSSWQNPNYGETFYLQNGIAYITPSVDSASYPLASWRIQGYRLPAALTSDSQVVEVPAEYCVYYAASMLDASMAEGPSLDPEQHAGRASNWLREAALIETRIGTNWLPNTLEVPW